jgi:chlorite dismutase
VHTDPAFFVDELRPFLLKAPFVDLTPKPEFTMFGRTYAIGYEHDLEQVLVNRTRQRVMDPKHGWVVWYPLRRSGAFSQLDHKTQMSILGEHGTIGRSYGEADLAQDIRLACHGLDKNDNDFVIGVVGQELMPLSHLVQRMRSTVQTSQYIERLGPFFVGKVVAQAPWA